MLAAESTSGLTEHVVDGAGWARLDGAEPGGAPATHQAERGDTAEAAAIAGPLAALVRLEAGLAAARAGALDRFLGLPPAPPPPFVVAITGGVAVGKSTVARALVDRLAGSRPVALVGTDGFLHPNLVLEERGLLERKGFPESFDVEALRRFLVGLRAGEEVRVPRYSHLVYDVLPDDPEIFRRPAVAVLDGLHLLSGPVGDLVDLGVYLQAEEADLEAWFLARFLAFRAAAARGERSFFTRFVAVPDGEVVAMALKVWSEVNLVNLRTHVEPERHRAHVVVEKGPGHEVRCVRLRRSPLGGPEPAS